MEKLFLCFWTRRKENCWLLQICCFVTNIFCEKKLFNTFLTNFQASWLMNEHPFDWCVFIHVLKTFKSFCRLQFEKRCISRSITTQIIRKVTGRGDHVCLTLCGIQNGISHHLEMLLKAFSLILHLGNIRSISENFKKWAWYLVALLQPPLEKVSKNPFW